MWRNIGLSLGAAIVLLAGVGFVLPDKTRCEQSITVNVPQQMVFDTLNNIKEFNKWSPFVKSAPDAVYTFSGPDSGTGASMSWVGKKARTGAQTITAATPPNRIDFAVELDNKPGSRSWFALTPDGAGTKVVWGFESMPYGLALWQRYLGAFVVAPMLKKGYAAGLVDFKAYVERKEGLPPAAASEATGAPMELMLKVDGETVNLASKPIVLSAADAAGSGINAAVANAYAQIDAYIKAQKLTPAGAPVAITHDYDAATAHWVFDAGVPVAAPPPGPPIASDGVTIGRTYAGKAVKFKYHGRADGTEPTYTAIEAWLKAKKFEKNGDPWEEYLSDDKTPKDAWDINIYYPVK